MEKDTISKRPSGAAISESEKSVNVIRGSENARNTTNKCPKEKCSKDNNSSGGNGKSHNPSSRESSSSAAPEKSKKTGEGDEDEDAVRLRRNVGLIEGIQRLIRESERERQRVIEFRNI